jgi:Interferon-induced transmembrane protein
MTGYWDKNPGLGQPPHYAGQPYGGYGGYGPQYGPHYGTLGPPPGYGYPTGPAGPPAAKPSTNIGWAIAAVFTFWPLAIPAFIFSGRVDNAWNIGDRAGAESASRSARNFGLAAVIVGIVVWVLVVIWVIVLISIVSKTVHHLPATIVVNPPQIS